MSQRKEVFTTGEAAKLCYLSQQTVIRCFDNGTLQGFKVPGSKFRRITRAGLIEFMVVNAIPLTNLGELSPEDMRVIAQARGEPDDGQVVGPISVNRVSGLLSDVA
jgi:hypothetical protein